MPFEASHGENAPLPTGKAARAGAEGELLAVLRNPALIAQVQEALLRIGASPVRPVAPEEATARLVGPGRPPLGLLCEPQPEERGWGALHAAAQDPFSPTRVLVLDAALAGNPGALLAALRRITGRPDPSEADEVAALRRGLAEGEVAMRYQPIVRISDRRPVGLEGLVRWLRPDGRRAIPLGPDAFIPMAERHGLALAVARAVGRMATQELVALRPRLALPISINLPLEVLQRPDTVPWLGRLCRECRLRPAMLGIELTETTPVHDLPLLRRAVLRLRGAGHPLWVDDMSLEERRDELLRLPFTGIKLDRFLVSDAARSRRSRAEMERLVALAHGRGMLVTAEGISSPALWHAVAMAGVDRAQGYAVGRPLPAAALPAWIAAWRGARGPVRDPA
ncbi:EAL domain-containing protein [Roseomonas populi]|uniref:EAL domain-containing protein n=1 Tax=Roseomonas populi TaxID=3121582 RepID=A0ABT1X8C1_9PROT|nr:EAL domain-containing protein [Roseomonas pecuniae]MCR0984355.1 EAL domain-containing protein [Roseomonas pecuniae]